MFQIFENGKGALEGRRRAEGARQENPEPSKKVPRGVLRRQKQKVLRRVLRTF